MVEPRFGSVRGAPIPLNEPAADILTADARRDPYESASARTRAIGFGLGLARPIAAIPGLARTALEAAGSGFTGPAYRRQLEQEQAAAAAAGQPAAPTQRDEVLEALRGLSPLLLVERLAARDPTAFGEAATLVIGPRGARGRRPGEPAPRELGAPPPPRLGGGPPPRAPGAADPFADLGLDRATATVDDVEAAYRREAMRTHPDVAPVVRAERGGPTDNLEASLAFLRAQQAKDAALEALGARPSARAARAARAAEQAEAEPGFRAAAEQRRQAAREAATSRPRQEAPAPAPARPPVTPEAPVEPARPAAPIVRPEAPQARAPTPRTEAPISARGALPAGPQGEELAETPPLAASAEAAAAARAVPRRPTFEEFLRTPTGGAERVPLEPPYPLPELPSRRRREPKAPTTEPVKGERVRAAAIQLADGSVYEGTTHADAIDAAQQAGRVEPSGQLPAFETGFATTARPFITKDQATAVGQRAGQLPERLPMGRTKPVAQDFEGLVPEGVPLVTKPEEPVPVPTRRPPGPHPQAVPESNPKYAKMSNDELDARWLELADRIDRMQQAAGKGIMPWTRRKTGGGDAGVEGVVSGTAVSGKAGRAIGQVKIAGRLMGEVEEELRRRGQDVEGLYERAEERRGMRIGEPRRRYKPKKAPPPLELEEDRPQDIGEALVEEYGETDNPGDAGYLLSDGRLIDFSEGGGMGRTADHRAVGELFKTETKGPERSQWDYVQAVMDDGHARISVQDDLLNVDIATRLTGTQLRAIQHMVEDFGRPVNLVADFTEDGRVLASVGRDVSEAWEVERFFMDLYREAYTGRGRVGEPSLRQEELTPTTEAPAPAPAETEQTAVAKAATQIADAVTQALQPIIDRVSEVPAFHGTPHRFPKFEQEKIGTGQGAASFGYGFYFAENPDVARHYRSTLAPQQQIKKWTVGNLTLVRGLDADGMTRYVDYSPKTSEDAAVVRATLTEKFLVDEHLLREESDPERRKAFALQRIDDEINDWRESWPAAVPEAERIRASVAKDGVTLELAEPEGAVYDVTLNVEPHELLDWDKPIVDQPETARRAINVVLRQEENVLEDAVPTGTNPPEPDDADYTGGEVYQILTRAMDGAENVSAALRKAGAKGIRYLDQGSRPAVDIEHYERRLRESRAALAEPNISLERQGFYRNDIEILEAQLAKARAIKPTSNYVIFDAKDIGTPKRVEEPPGRYADTEAKDPVERAAEHMRLTFGNPAKAKRAALELVRSAGPAAQLEMFGPRPMDPAAREAAVARGAQPRAWVTLKGQSPKTPEELHGMLWPFRSPIMERLHFLLYDATGAIIEHQMHTSGAISYVEMRDGFAEQLIADMDRLGAVEAEVAHNHPSGNPRASDDDIVFTGFVGKRLERAGKRLRGQYVIDDVKGTWIEHLGTTFAVHDIQVPRTPDPADWTATHGPKLVGTGEVVPARIKGRPGVRRVEPVDVAKVLLATSGVLPEGRFDLVYFTMQGEVVALEPHTLAGLQDAHVWLPKRMAALAADSVMAVVGAEAPSGAGGTAFAKAVEQLRFIEGVTDVYQVWQPEGEAHPRWLSAANTGIGFRPPPQAPNVSARRVFERAERPAAPVVPEQPAEAVNDILTKTEAGGLNIGAVQDFLRKNFTSQGDLPPLAFEKNIERVGRINSVMRQTVYTMRAFRKALRDAGWHRPTKVQLKLLDDALKGGSPSAIPVKARPAIARMRRELDILSQALISEGVIEGPLVAKVEANLGVYTTRSYRVFDDPEWAKKVPADVRNKFRALLRAEHPNLSAEDLEGLFNTFLYRGEDGPLAILRKAALGSKDLSILQRRKDIPPELRALWGEYRDPRVNYARSMVKMAHLIENHRFLREMLEGGLGRFFFQRPTVRGGVSYHTEFAAPGSKVLEPLNGLFTSPEIAEAFRQLDDITKDPAWLRVYYMANGAAKYAKTVGSVVTHVRNTLSNVGFAVMQGHWRVLKAGSAVQANVANLLGNSPKWQAYYRHVVELGVVHESVGVGELKDALRDAHKAADNPEPISFGGRALGGAGALYRAEDEVWKIYAYENELARYKKAFPKMAPGDLEKRAATTVRRTWPTYSLVPRGIKLLRRFPLLGPFVSFPAEGVRVTANTFRLVLEELADPATRGIGAQRLVGLMLVAIALPVAIQAMRDMMGVTKDDEDDLRQLVPPWSENGALLIVNRDRETVRYVDLSYVDPFSVIRKPLIALLRNEPWEERLAEAASEVGKPFLGEELLAGRIADLARNRTAQGFEVWNPADTPERQAAAAVGHLLDVFVPGTATSLERVRKGMLDQVSESGRAYVPEVELLAMLTGQRIVTQHLAQGLRAKAFDFTKEIDNARRLFLRPALRAGTVSSEDLVDAFNRSESARRDAYAQLSRTTLAARRLGLEEPQATSLLRSLGLTAQTVEDILAGGYRPYNPGASIWKRLQQAGNEARMQQWQDLSQEGLLPPPRRPRARSGGPQRPTRPQR